MEPYRDVVSRPAGYFPLSVYYFHQFPLYFLFGNLFIMLPLVLMMYLGIAVLIPGLNFLAPVFEWIINFTNSVLRWLADLPYASFSSIWITLPQFILLSLALGLVIFGMINFNKRFIFSALFIFICYEILVSYSDISRLQQRNIIFFALRKNYAAAFTNGKKTVLVTDLNELDKSYIFSVKPTLMQMQIDKIHFLNLKKDSVIGNFILKDSQIAFYQYNLMLIDDRFNYKRLTGNGNFSGLWITGNTRFNLNNLSSGVKYKTMLIDATNKDYKIRALQKNNKDTYVLKKNKAYLVQLTQ